MTFIMVFVAIMNIIMAQTTAMCFASIAGLPHLRVSVLIIPITIPIIVPSEIPSITIRIKVARLVCFSIVSVVFRMVFCRCGTGHDERKQ